MNSTLKQALEIAKFDLGTAVRGKKAFIAIFLYAGLALLVAVVASFLQNKLLAEPAAVNAISEAKDQIQSAVTSVLGNDAVLANYLVNQPLILMVFFWLTQSFLPLLVAVVSSDILNREIKTGSARFVLLRTSRTSMVLGKALSHSILFVVAAVLSWLTFVIYIAFNLQDFNLAAAMPTVLKWFGVTLVFGFCYLGLTMLVSSLINQTGVTILVLFVVLAALGSLAQSETFGWASPSYYRYKVWSPRANDIMTGVAAYVGFGLVFFAAAWQRFVRRDI